MNIQRFIGIALISTLVVSLCSGCVSITPTTISSSPTSSSQFVDEEYYILMRDPSQNSTLAYDAKSPAFTWRVYKGYPQTFTLEIDYLGGEPYFCKTTSSVSYVLNNADWEHIKANAPVQNGKKTIHWRIKIEYMYHPNRDPYYTNWNYFYINAN